MYPIIWCQIPMNLAVAYNMLGSEISEYADYNVDEYGGKNHHSDIYVQRTPVFCYLNPVDEFIGFICGIISQDHDLQHMYFDSFLKIACVEQSDVSATIAKLETISAKFHVDFVLSISIDESELPESLKSKVIISL